MLNRFNSAVAIPVLACLGIAFASSSHAEEWPRFRGPNGSGVNRSVVLPATWKADGLRFDVKLPDKGHGSPVLWGKQVFLLSGSDKAVRLLCLSGGDGKTVWSRPFKSKPTKKHRMNSFASSTPAVDDDHVYACYNAGGRFTVVAVHRVSSKTTGADKESGPPTTAGEVAWTRDLGPFTTGHGFAVSPMVHDGKVIIANDQDKGGFLLALDAATGKDVWRIKRGQSRTSYSTPCVFTPKGSASQLIFTDWQHGVSGVEAKTGKLLWQLDVFGKPKPERAIGSPVVAGDVVIGSCGFVTKLKHLVAIKPNDASKLGDDVSKNATELWRIERAVPHVPTPLVIGEHAYLWSDLGIVTCVKLKDGSAVYRERVTAAGRFFGSPVSDGKTIFSVTDSGNVVAIAVGPKFKVLGETKLEETVRSTPAIGQGGIFIRTETRLLCVAGEKGLQ